MTLTDQLAIPDDSPFPEQNLPYGAFQLGEGGVRIGVALGDWIIDLAAIERLGLLADPTHAKPLFDQPTLNAFMARGKPAWVRVRHTLQQLITDERSPLLDASVRHDVLHRQADCQLHLPVSIGDYTDFYSSREHASNVGLMFRGPDQPLLPNWLHMPIAYHGRASSIVLSGTPIQRPTGQVLINQGVPALAASAELDFELEVGFLMGPGTGAGEAIPISAAADHIFGLVLVNDWSARDIQRWEYRPLGPFLGKNFATSISPWVVPLAALEPFRCAGPQQDPRPLPYLQTDDNWAVDIQLEAHLQTAAMAAAELPAVTLTETNYRYLYWNMLQQLAHHTINGCALRPGDLLASGTISGPEPSSYGSMLELAWGGQRPIRLPNGETRSFLEDGDTLTLAGWCQGDRFRIGFGGVSGTILPALRPAS